MMHVLPCEHVRDQLAAFHDGELPLDAQVAIQGHLQDCVSCRLEAAALADLSAAFRTMAGDTTQRNGPDTGLLTASVLERIRVERQLSLGAQVREWFEDMHLVWAGLGATLAVVFCVFASAGVLHAASQECPDSLAGIITTIARGASDPVRLVASADATDHLLDTAAALHAADSADLMISAFVSRDGRIQSISVLEQARAMSIKPDVLIAMIEAASRARFSPLQASRYASGFNVVWFVTSTTVRGAANYDLYLLSPPRVTTPPLQPHPSPSPKSPSA